jgi:hypothetical protein
VTVTATKLDHVEGSVEAQVARVTAQVPIDGLQLTGVGACFRT